MLIPLLPRRPIQRQTTIGKYPSNSQLPAPELISRRILIAQTNLSRSKNIVSTRLNKELLDNQTPLSSILLRLTMQCALDACEVELLQEIDANEQQWTNELLNKYLAHHEKYSEIKSRIN